MTSSASHLERNTLPAVLGKAGGQRVKRHTSQKAVTSSRREWSMAKIRIRAVQSSELCFCCFFFLFQILNTFGKYSQCDLLID